MSRRTIDIEGATYKWQRLGAAGQIVVFPPKGGGGPRVLSDDTYVHDPESWGDGYPAVTPGLVAELIYRHVLRREPPARAARPVPVAPATAPAEPAWETSHEVPRVYVVLGTLRLEGQRGATTAVVETHVDPVTADRAARALAAQAHGMREHMARLVRWHDRDGGGEPPRYVATGAARGWPCPGLDAWFDRFAMVGLHAPLEVSFAVSAVPLRVPAAPATRPAIARMRRDETLRTLSGFAPLGTA